jgi:tetratricopeptide (TPR) repeat protein/SAM-dependent methyltransferase
MNRSERRATRKQGGGQEHFAAALRCHQAGALAEAEGHYRRVLILDPNHAGVLHNLGILAIQTGRNDMAVDLLGKAITLNRRSPDAHYNLAVALEALGRPDDAIVHYGKALALKDDHAEAHMNLGNALSRRGRTDEALACYQRVLALQPQSAMAHYNAANVLALGGKLDDAAASYRTAIGLKPDFAEAHNNLGNTLKDRGFPDEAEAAYLRALELKPDYADAHNNLGILMMARGATAPAIARYRRALQARPDFVEAHNNLGLALFSDGKAEDAVGHFQKAIALKPDYVEAYLNLARQLYAAGDVEQAAGVAARALAVEATPDTRDLFARYAGALQDGQHAEPYRDLIGQALREGWTRATRLEPVGIRLIKRNAAVAAVADALARPAPAASSQPGLGPQELAAIAGDRLLHDLMISARVCDRELERLLTPARHSLLDAAADETVGAAPEVLAFACALARQCFINEYVFAATAEELQAVRRIADAMAGRMKAGDACPVLWPVVVASYGPLHAVSGSNQLLGTAWPDPVNDMLIQQVREPREEQAIRASLPALTPIDDGVSRLVREQYEENPYPRWIRPAPALKAYAADEYFRTKFPRAPMRPLRTAGQTDILIAGCGTGAQAVETSRTISGARVLAIDLSATSLAYAVRKTRALGLAIEYAQADILRLGGIGRTFDVIEASGVLHHLADPMAGWRILLSLLKPGGVMSVGLYSRLARTDVNAARAFIAARGYGSTAEDIRRCRQDILSLPDGAPGRTVTHAGDFYSMSECRDLLFHVQEHQHTLPEIAAFVAGQDLQFLGFDMDARLLALYGEKNPDDPAMIELDRWHRFETENPGLFAAMYQFAVQKR